MAEYEFDKHDTTSSDDPRMSDSRHGDASRGDEDHDVAGDVEDGLETVTMRIRRRIPGRRIDKYLRHRVPRLSRTMIQRLIKSGDITVNNRLIKASYEPDGGDIVEVRVPPPVPTEIILENIPIDIIHEDEHMMAINKRTGIICHPSKPGQSGTIANAVAYYLGENIARGEDPSRPGIVHRLDKNTSGVMLIAKTDEALWRLCLQFERRTVHKTYIGIVEGSPRLDGDIIDQPLAAHPMIKERCLAPGMPVRDMLFKEAVTRYRVVRRFRGFALVEMHPKTGRTHQLRIHMSSVGCPMLGDRLYGGHLVSECDLTGKGDTAPLIEFQSLHAARIEFAHPITEKPMTLEAPLSPKLQGIVDLLESSRAT